MKISETHLRYVIREAIKDSLNSNQDIHEGIFGGALKGLLRSIPGVGNMAADAHTSKVLDAIDKKLTQMDLRIKALENTIKRPVK